MYELELKWGRYGLLKTTASSWRTNSHLANLELQRAKLKPNLRKWFCNLRTHPGSNSTRMYHIQNRLSPLPLGWHPEICCAAHSIRCLTSGIQELDGRGGVSTSPDIISGWRFSEAFQLPPADISGSEDSAYLESFAAILQCRGFLLKLPIFATDIVRYFALDIWCLNPQTLLVIHQLQDSLVIKFGKRMHYLKIFLFCNFHI